MTQTINHIIPRTGRRAQVDAGNWAQQALDVDRAIAVQVGFPKQRVAFVDERDTQPSTVAK